MASSNSSLERSESSPGSLKNASAAGHPLESVMIYSSARTATHQGSGKVGKWRINFMQPKTFASLKPPHEGGNQSFSGYTF